METQFNLIEKVINISNFAQHKTHCLSIPKLPQKFKEHIKSCQKEVQVHVANEMLKGELNLKF